MNRNKWFYIARRRTCKHPPTRLYSWFAWDGTLCVVCLHCVTVLRGGVTL